VGQPLAGERDASDPGLFTFAPLRSKSARAISGASDNSLRFGQFKRAVRRQFPLFALIAAGGLAVGALYARLMHAPDSAIAVWAAFGLVFAYSVAATRELARDAIGAMTPIRHRGFAIVGATPELSRQTLRELPPDKRTPLGCIIYQPASGFSAAFRHLQGAIAGQKLVAFVGSVPNEGATTAALCSAVSAAQQGLRVIILDCDLRRRSLTRLLECEPDIGMLEAAEAPERWMEAVLEESETGLHYIPAAKLKNPWRNLFGQPRLPELFAALREHYDLIVLDCPPALSITDGAMLARGADLRIVVAAWDDTPIAALRGTMRALRQKTPVATGICVNRVPSHYKYDPKQTPAA
jgi:Mrp family chromosome partitioning ATPase